MFVKCRGFVAVTIITGIGLVSMGALAKVDSSLIALAQQVANTAQSGKPALVLSSQKGLTEAEAYILQTLAVKQRLGSAKPHGFKAGLTSLASQQKFSVHEPVAGVLLAAGLPADTSSPIEIEQQRFNRLMIEAEMGFRFKVAIDKPVADIQSLKTKVAEVLPVVELPDLGFDQPKALKGVDIIANNVLAREYIYGKGLAIEALAINKMAAQVYRNGDLILEGKSVDAMGDQWQALLWLVNRCIANGWQITPGQVFITGAMGKMLLAQEGSYLIDYGPLGKINFRVVR